MTAWPARAALETIAGEIATHLHVNPGDAEGHLFHAKIRYDLGDEAGASDSYRRALAVAPEHLGVLIGCAITAQRDGLRGDACELLERAVALHPEAAAAHANLAHLVAPNEPSRALAHYELALALDPTMREAHGGLCTLLCSLGDAEGARLHRNLAYEGAATRVLPYRGAEWPIPALLLVSTDGGNVYTDQLLDDRIYQVTKLFVEAFDLDAPLPLHGVVVNGIGDADRSRAALVRAATLVARTSARVVNDPSTVAMGGRIADAARMYGIAGLRVPWARAFDRAASPAPPFLLRVAGHHMGRYFERIDDAQALARADQTLPKGERIAVEWIDTRDADGSYRKYRVMIVDGQLYPLHLAIGTHWKMHYFSADMLEHQAHRDEERAFLANMGGVLGTGAMAALQRVADRLGLDYAGIDFGLKDGRVVLFEANASMTVIEPDADPRWEYRRAAWRRITEAMATMVCARSIGGMIDEKREFSRLLDRGT